MPSPLPNGRWAVDGPMTATHPRVLTIAADRPFLQVLAEAILGGFPTAGGAPSDMLGLARWTILVPTRRAARELEDIFLRLTRKGGLLLPKIRPIGDIDEDLLARDDDAATTGDLPPAISRTGQQLLLIDLIDDWARANPQTRLAREIATAPHQTQGLAVSLAEFLDGLETENIDVGRIPELYDLENARHRDAILQFLAVAREAYPARLAAAGLIGPQQRRALILKREAARLADARPTAPFIAAGSTGSIEATRTLLKAIAGLPNGAVVLPGLDCGMDDASWLAAGPTHPQFAFRQLLPALGIDRADVRELGEAQPGRRSWLSSEMMRPADTAHQWRGSLEDREPDIAAAMEGVELVEARSLPEEAMAVALILREVLETPGKTACLVTSDRQMARRVKAELGRWNIVIDDSAGEPLIHLGGGAFVNLLIDAVLQNFSAPSLAALLRHGLCTFDETPETARRAAGLIELALLRTGTGAPRIAALPHALRMASESGERGHLLMQQVTDENWQQAIAFAARAAEVLGPLAGNHPVTLSAHLARLIKAAEAMAGERLWEGEAGDVLREAVGRLSEDSPHLRHCDMARAAAIIRHWLQAIAVRRPAENALPLSILGLLEARLMRPDVMVLAGLNEGVWPAAPDPGPWLNRPMRDKLGMSQPERQIGQTAHDFAQAFGCSEVKLVWSRRSGDAPVTPSRWILRLQMILQQADLKDLTGKASSWCAIARQLVEPGQVTPAPKPKPCPPAELRPRQLSVTRIEKLVRDPYAIYARHVLRLEPLEPIAAIPDPARRGIIFHAAIGDFLSRYPVQLPGEAEAELLRLGESHFAAVEDYPALTGFWWPRFRRIARWLVAEEPGFRQGVERIVAEAKGSIRFAIGGEDFTLTCRADRIDLLANGAARISDYKTGTVPSNRQVEVGLAPQLTLQAAILEQGGFEGVGPRQTDGIVYVKLSGGEPAGEFKPINMDVMALAHEHLDGLKRVLTSYAQPSQPYLPRVMMEREDDEGDYDHLSRFREWALSGGGS